MQRSVFAPLTRAADPMRNAAVSYPWPHPATQHKPVVMKVVVAGPISYELVAASRRPTAAVLPEAHEGALDDVHLRGNSMLQLAG